MIWYVKHQALEQLNDVAKGDTRGLMHKLHLLLEAEKAFTLHGYEHSLTPRTQQALNELIQKGTFVKVVVG